MLKDILENAIRTIENERAGELQRVQQVAVQEKVYPFNESIDQSFQKAVDELTEKASEQIASIRQNLENDKKALLEAGNNKKQEFYEKTIKDATSEVAYKYDLVLAKLKKHIEELGE